MRKISPLPGFFQFSCSLFVRYPYLFLLLDCPAFCLLSLLYNTHKTQTSMPPAGFERTNPRLRPLRHCNRQNSAGFFPSLFFCPASAVFRNFLILLSLHFDRTYFLSVLASAFYLSCKTHTKHKHPCPRQDSNPQSQLASYRRPSGIRSPDRPARSESYSMSCPGAPL